MKTEDIKAIILYDHLEVINTEKGNYITGL